MEINAASLRSEHHIEIGVSWSLSLKLLMKPLDRLNVYSRPTAIVEVLGHRVDHGIEGTNVDGTPLDHVVKDAVENDIFKVLGIRNH